MRARSRFWVARSATLVAPILLAACQPGVLNPAGPIAAADRTILIDSVLIMLAIVLPTIALALGCAWWFRAGNTRARFMPNFVYSGQLELLVWGIPLLTIMLLGGVAWIGSHQLDPYKPIVSKTPALNVQVVSLDWKWLFIYPDQHIASVNMLEIPAGTPVHFSLTSASVMSAFFVPQLGSMIYTMNGMTTQLNLQADKQGVFQGLSSHYNGDGFAGMHFEVHAVTQAEFTAWVTATRGTGPTLDTASYSALAKQSLSVTPFTYRQTEDGLFDHIVTQKLPPAPGPEASTSPRSTP
jgi:cytochrome o ubiquinol oxidase subunit 2